MGGPPNHETGYYGCSTAKIVHESAFIKSAMTRDPCVPYDGHPDSHQVGVKGVNGSTLKGVITVESGEMLNAKRRTVRVS